MIVGPGERVAVVALPFVARPRVLPDRVEVDVLQEDRRRRASALRQVAQAAGVPLLGPVARDRLPFGGQREDGARRTVPVVLDEDDARLLRCRVEDDDVRRMPAGGGAHLHLEVGENAVVGVVDRFQEADGVGVEDRALMAEALFVGVGPVERLVVAAEPKPDGTVAREADVDALLVTGRVRDRRVSAIKTAPVAAAWRQTYATETCSKYPPA